MMETTITTTETGSSSNCDGDSPFLPEDVLFNILLWLPVMSLLRFKSVCKSWCSLIDSSAFIDQHLQHHHYGPTLKNKSYNLLAMNPNHKSDDFGNFYNGILNFYLLSGDKYERSVEFNLPGFSNYQNDLITMQTCALDGIICLSYLRECVINNKQIYIMDVYLWNPATQQLTALPQPPPVHGFPIIHKSIGFGFDVKTNDYKVVTFWVSGNPLELENNLAQIYSLRTDSWRTIDDRLPVDITYVSTSSAPYRNGTSCWLGGRDAIFVDYDEFIHNHCMISFDFTNEVFRNMPLPDVHSVKSDEHPHLAVFRDHIACIITLDLDEGRYEIWVLNEYGVKESWTKLFKVGPLVELVGWTQPIGLSKNEGYFLFVKEEQLCMYDFVTQEIKPLLIQQFIYCDLLQVAVYKESLVSLKRGHAISNKASCAVEIKPNI